MRQFKDKGHISYPQEKPRTRATFPTHKKSHTPHPQRERGKGVNMGTLHCGGWGGCLPNLDHIYYIFTLAQAYIDIVDDTPILRILFAGNHRTYSCYNQPLIPDSRGDLLREVRSYQHGVSGKRLGPHIFQPDPSSGDISAQ